MRSYYSMAVGALLSVVASIPARADTDLTGKWVGQFNGVQIEIPPERGPFGHAREEAEGRADTQVRRQPAATRHRDPEQMQGARGPQADSKSTSSAHRPVPDHLELYRLWRPRRAGGDLADCS